MRSLGSRIKKLERARFETSGRACAECGGDWHVELGYEGLPIAGGPRAGAARRVQGRFRPRRGLTWHRLDC